MSLALQEVPSPQHLVGSIAECDQLHLRHKALSTALGLDRSLSKDDYAACVTFHIGMYGKGCIDICNNMNRFIYFKCHTRMLTTPYVLYRTGQLVVVVPLGHQHSLCQERYGSQNVWSRPLTQVE